LILQNGWFDVDMKKETVPGSRFAVIFGTRMGLSLLNLIAGK
jgi:hypothetical protein